MLLPSFLISVAVINTFCVKKEKDPKSDCTILILPASDIVMVSDRDAMDAKDSNAQFRAAVEVLRSVKTADQFKKKKDEFLDHIEESMVITFKVVRDMLSLTSDGKPVDQAAMASASAEHAALEHEMDVQMRRIGKMKGGQALLDQTGEEMGARLEPHMNEIGELMMQDMGGLMGTLLGGMGNAFAPDGGSTEGDDAMADKNGGRTKRGSESGDECQEAQKCAICGAAIPEGQAQCPHCHEEPLDLRAPCPECNYLMYPGDKDCMACGHALDDPVPGYKCPNCGAMTRERPEVCTVCGNKSDA